MHQPFINETHEKMNNNKNNISMNGTTTRASSSNEFTQPIQPNFFSSDQFKFKF